MWCHTSLPLLGVAVAMLLTCSCGNGGSQEAVSGEVRAFLDENGTLHWGGRAFSRMQPSGPSSTSRDSDVDVHICQAGEFVQARYGSMEKILTLSRPLPAGSVLVLSCTEEFGDDGFAGHLLLRCGANALLEVEIQCGCAPGPVFRPLQGLRPANHASSNQCSMSPPRSIDQRAPDVTWSSARLDEGGTESRECSELLAGMRGSWQIRCNQGRLCTDANACQAPQPVRHPLRESDSEEVEASEQLLPHRGLQDQTFQNGTTPRRRLNKVCDAPPQDNWWPDVICGSLEAVPYSTVAGGNLPGNQMLQLNAPHGLFVSPFNNELYVCDWKNHRIQRWTQASDRVNTVAGVTGITGTFLDTQYLFNPSDVMVAGRNKLIPCAEIFIADESNNRILRWPPYAPQGFMVVGYAGAREELNHPTGLFVTPDYHVYIADRLNHRVIVWSQMPGRLQWQYNRTVAGWPKFGKTGPGTQLQALDRPSDVAVSLCPGCVRDTFIADFGNDRVVLWTPTAQIGQVVGECYGPYSVYVNDDGAVFAACRSIHCVKRYENVAGVWTETGTTGKCGFFVTAPSKDDPSYASTINELFNPSSVFVDIYGNIFVSDTFNARVIKRGRDPLTQWIVSNGRATAFQFAYRELAFFTDLGCADETAVKTYISAEGVAREPWRPECTETGTGICEPDVAWIGRQFYGEKAIRCIILTVDYDDSDGDDFQAAVRYWKGSEYKTLYNFGRIKNGMPTVLRYPRFDTYNPFCVKGQRSCSMTITGDWVTDGDVIIIKVNDCRTGLPMYGFPNGGISIPATQNGTHYQIGDDSFPDTIQADASDGLGDGTVNYLICWCDSRINFCFLPEDFTNYVSLLRVDGPFEGQTIINYRGTRLVINNLKGINLKPDDRMNVISGGCGISATDVLGVPRPGNSVIARSNPSTTGADYRWGDDYNTANYVTANPGIYLLCWCRPTLSPCKTLVDYQATAGTLWINGPYRGHVYDCIKGDECDFLIRGFNLNRSDTILMLARCGFLPLTPGFPPLVEAPPAGVSYALSDYALVSTGSTGANSTYGWGNKGILPVVGVYFICWCSANVACADIMTYNTEVGTLTVYGPEELDIECAIGDDCSVVMVQGLGLERSSRALVLAGGGTCGDANSRPEPGFPGEFPAISFTATDAGTAFFWGKIEPKSVAPGIYTVCWCHKGLPCSLVTDFRAPLGTVFIKGPDTWTELRVCGTGKDCVVTISGFGLSLKDTMIMVNGECVTGTLALGGRSQAVLNTAKTRTDNGELHVWDEIQVPDGGDFKACWCATNCDTVERYNVEVGRLIISYPQPDNTVLCYSGSICVLTLQGFGLQPTDKLGIVSSSCGGDSLIQGIPYGGESRDTRDIPANMALATFQFGDEFSVLKSIGGIYTLCWCADMDQGVCQIIEDYNILAGRITVGAPSVIHDFTCYNGLRCSVSHVVGLGLSNGDQLRVTSTCQLQSNVAGFPQKGVSSGALALGTAFSWGEVKLSVIVGVYRLCWCAERHDCDRQQAFSTDIGTMTVGGPVSGKVQQCRSGYPCQLDNIEGFQLRPGDVMILLMICGQGNPIYGWMQGLPWRAWPPFISEQPLLCERALNGEVCTSFKAEDPRMLAEPGKYRMCWCSVTSPTCNSAADFTVDVGLFINIGAESDQEFECAAGFVCTIREMLGTDLENGDRYRVVLTSANCTMGQVVPGVPNEGISEPASVDGTEITWSSAMSRTTLPRDDYALCWCSYLLACDSFELFAMKGGTLVIVGPYAGQDRECVLGKVCVVYDIEGVGLKNKDRMLVVVGSCGPDAEPAPRFPRGALSFGAEDTGATYRFELLINAVSGRYRMCWCPESRAGFDIAPVPYDCTDASGNAIHGDFLVDIGELHLPEVPRTGEIRECTSGIHCQVTNFTGSHDLALPDASQILVKKSFSSTLLFDRLPPDTFTSQICIDGSIFVEAFPDVGESQPAINQGTTFDWGLPEKAIWASGGTYIMCWKPAEAETYAYYIGVLIVLGPYSGSGQIFNCTKSSICELFNVSGVGLGDGDYYRVMSPCAQDSSRTDAQDQVTVGIPVAQMSNSKVTWSAEEFQGAPRFYKLCWCHRSSACDHAVDFKATVGDMVIFGPTAGQNKKCDRGQPCIVANVTGINMKPLDSIFVLVECATGPIVPGFDPPTASAIPTGNSQFSFSWPYVTSSPGIFRICWCAADTCGTSSEVSPMAEYDVEMGIITIQGPDNMLWVQPAPVYPPPIGFAPLHNHQWDIILNGVNLMVFPDALVRIMLICPTNNTPGVPVPDRIPRIGTPTDRSGERFSFPAADFSKIIPASKGVMLNWESNLYELCWCRGPTVEFPHDHCRDVAKFALPMGKLIVFCPQGREPTEIGCQDCALGQYKDINGNIDCRSCPVPATMTTASTGTVLLKNCFCIPGYYFRYPLTCDSCLENHWCLGGLRSWDELTPAEVADHQRKDMQPHMQPQPCPANSGAWEPSDCTYEEVSEALRSRLKAEFPWMVDEVLLCTGRFPAESALDCSCIQGFESFEYGPRACMPCEVDYFKPYRGNATKCFSCNAIYPKSSTLGYRAATTCQCESGLYMERDQLKNPVRCVECPIGYYCVDSERIMCPPGKNTESTGSPSLDYCLCGAGFYENQTWDEALEAFVDKCLPCPGGSIYYKDSIGNFPCDKECPANSMIPESMPGAKGPENCVCAENYIQSLDVETLEYFCEEDLLGAAKNLRTSVRLTAVASEVDFTYHKGADGKISVPPDEEVINDPAIKRLLASQLGLPDAGRIVLEAQPYQYEVRRLLLEQLAGDHGVTIPVDRELHRRLLSAMNGTNTSNGSNVSIDYSRIVVPIKVIIWQSTVVETKSLKDRFETITEADTSNWAEGLKLADPKYHDLVDVYIDQTKTRVDFYTGECPPFSALPVGTTFVSPDDSCKCMPGYEPKSMVPQGQLESDECFVSPEDSNKCVPCCTYKGMGKYKDSVGDERCRACPKYAPDNQIFPATSPLKAAKLSTQCICTPGFFRPGEMRRCEICPYGHYCYGDTVVNPCPENEWTQEEQQDNVTDCKCSFGYFRPLVGFNPACVGCDPGYFKGTVDDGIGRCVDRCSLYFGRRSTSRVAAESIDECVCQIQSYMKVDINAGSGFQCEACPDEGVTCLGGKENVSNGTDWVWQHTEPKAKSGWYMLDVRSAFVEECKTQSDGESVCTGSSVCSEGHEGFLCGNCMPGYTRNKFPDPCRSCDKLPSTFVLMLQTAGEFTAQSLWALFLAYSALTKTETKKNVMTVLLRMFSHWSAQIGILQSNFNLTKLKPVSADEAAAAEQAALEAEEEEEDLTIVETNATAADAGDSGAFAWPPWYDEATEKLNFLAEAATQVGSQQEVVECMIDRLFQMGGERQRYWRLVGPAAFWLAYPILLAIWTVFLATLISFMIIPIVAYFLSPKSNAKKRKKRLMRRRRKELLAKRKAERELERQKSFNSNTPSDGAMRDVLEVMDKFEEDSSESSTDSEDGDSNLTGAERWKGLFHNPPMLPLVDELDSSIANPSRFTYEYVEKEDDGDVKEAEKQKHVEYIMELFRARPVCGWAFIFDVMPWIIIVFNNVWPVVTSRMVELLNCEKFVWSGSKRPEGTVLPATFLMSHPDTKCMTLETEHGVMAMIAISGLAAWSFGIVFGFSLIIYNHDLQKPFVTRNFGYLLEGYEPQYWYWELIVKKVDLLVTALITYTSVVTDPRAKILLYSVQAAIAFAVQLSTGPYDNRQLRLLDRMENVGLFVREVLFTGVAFSLLFAFDKYMTLGLSITLIILNGYYLGTLVLHAADDFVTTQVAVLSEQRVLFAIGKRNKIIKKKRKLKQDETVTEEEIGTNVGIDLRIKIFAWLQQNIFFGGGGDTGWRHHQLLRCVWNGPGSDAVLYLPDIWDGCEDPSRGVLKRLGLQCVRVLFGISNERQQDALSECISSFINTMLSLAQFDQFPGRLTDLIFFLARAVKRLKKNMEKYPDAQRPPHEGDQHGKPTKFDDTELLKLALLEELFHSLTAEVRAKRELLAEMREGTLKDALEKESVPVEAAWDVLDKLTNDQLRTAAMHPVEIYKRIDFNLTLSRANESIRESLAETVTSHKAEMKVRRRMYRFLDYEMRAKIEEDPDLTAHQVHTALNALPLAELQRILNDVDSLIDVAEYYQKRGRIQDVFKGDVHNILTVEDLNSMLMFIQKLPYKQLHLVIEWTTMLLDFLVLPAKAYWRDDLVARGNREKSDPRYYIEHRRLWQKMREEAARDELLAKMKEEEDRAEAAAVAAAEEREEELQMKAFGEIVRVPCPVARKSFFEMEEEKKRLQQEQREREEGHPVTDLSHVRGSTHALSEDLAHLDEKLSEESMPSFGSTDSYLESAFQAPGATVNPMAAVASGPAASSERDGASLFTHIEDIWRRLGEGAGVFDSSEAARPMPAPAANGHSMPPLHPDVLDAFDEVSGMSDDSSLMRSTRSPTRGVSSAALADTADYNNLDDHAGEPGVLDESVEHLAVRKDDFETAI